MTEQIDTAERARQALQAGKLGEARELFARSLRDAEAAADRHAQRAAELQLGVCDFLAGRQETARATFERLLARPDLPGSVRARARGNLGLVQKDRGAWADAEQSFSAALEQAEALADTQLAARQRGNLALVHFLRGRLDAGQAVLQQAMESFQALGDLPGLVDGLLLLGEISLRTGEPQKAAWALGEARRLAEQGGYAAGRSRGLELGGRLCEQLGEPAQAEALLERALQAFCDQGDLRGQAAVLQRQADLLCQRGELGAAETRLHEAGRLLKARDHPRAYQELRQRRLLLRTRSQGTAFGLAKLPELLRTQRSAGDPGGLAGTLLTAARLHLRAGALVEAAQEAREAQDIAERCALPEARLSALLLRCELACQALQMQEARALLGAAGGQATPYLAARAALLGAAARLDRLAGLAEAARAHSSQALELWQRLQRPQARAVEVLRQARLDRDAGALADARRRANEARRLFARCGDRRGVLACRVEAAALQLVAGEPAAALSPLADLARELREAGELLLASRAELWAREAAQGCASSQSPVEATSTGSALLGCLATWLDGGSASSAVVARLREAGFALHATRLGRQLPR